VCDGRLLDGRAGNAGHLGHVIVDPLGRECGCGARGCLEAEASGTAIRTITGRPAQDAPVELRIRTGRLVGRAVASVLNLLDLPLAVVAGSVALGFGDHFFDAANAELERCCRLEFSRGARILRAGCGAAGPILGAAAVGRVGVGVPVLDGVSGGVS
jgi:glucokinase